MIFGHGFSLDQDTFFGLNKENRFENRFFISLSGSTVPIFLLSSHLHLSELVNKCPMTAFNPILV